VNAKEACNAAEDEDGEQTWTSTSDQQRVQEDYTGTENIDARDKGKERGGGGIMMG
jgi:hypothetical protein